MKLAVKITFELKTFEDLSEESVLKIIKDKVWEAEDFRDVQIIDFEFSGKLVKMRNRAKCKLRTYHNTLNGFETIDYTCEEVRKNHRQMIEEYVKVNHCDKVPRDRCYESYCLSIYDFLTKCNCDIPDA